MSKLGISSRGARWFGSGAWLLVMLWTAEARGEAALSFAEWRLREFSVAERMEVGISGSEADPDGDGLKNWSEWLRGTGPKSATGADEGTAWRDGSWLGILYTRLATAPVGHWVGGEASNDLADWSLPVVEEVMATEAGVETVRAKINMAVNPRAFIRTRHTRPGLSGLTPLATQESVNPELSHQVAPDKSAVRVWTGETPFSEPYFDLFVNRGGSIVKIRMNRWESRLIQIEAGSTIGFGTSDGRTLFAMADAPPAHLVTSFALSGTANCDRAGVPLWEPSTPHLTLPESSRDFEIASDGVERIIFIAEFDGTQWSPPRWLRTPKTGGVRVHSTCTQVAFANYAGDPIALNAPEGAIIGGTSATLHLTMPSVTGSSRYVTTVADLKAAIAAAVAGDEIVLASGTYPLDVNVTAASFSANHGVAGRVGAEGILIRSQTGAFADCSLSCASAGVGSWTLNQTGASALSAIKGITFDFTGTTSARFRVDRGKWNFENVRWTGANTGIDLFAFSGDGTATGLVLNALRCQMDTGGADLISGINTGGIACAVRIIDCVAFGTGVAESHQCVTTHGQGLPLQLFGGNFHSAQYNALAPGSGVGEGRMYWFFGQTSDITRACRVQDTSLFGCVLARSAAIGLKNSYALGWTGNIIRAGFSEHVAKLGLVEGNWFQHAGTGAYGMQLYALTQSESVKQFNVVSGFSEGIRMSDSSTGATGTTTVAHTSIVNCAVGVRASDTRLSFALDHLATQGSTTGLTTTSGSMARMTRSFNTLDPIVSAFYTPLGTGDLINSDAALDSRFFPAPSGNCDGNGDPSSTNWVGGTDYEGFALRLASSVMDRGARCRPRIILGAELFPDIW